MRCIHRHLNKLLLVGLALATGGAPASGHHPAIGEPVQVLMEWGVSGSSLEGEPSSDWTLSTVDVHAQAALRSDRQLYIGLLWEEDSREDDPLDRLYLQETWNTIELRIGRFYQSFGPVESQFISDPFTLELAELNRIGLSALGAVAGVELEAGLIQSEVSAALVGHLDGYVAAHWQSESGVVIGLSWISDLLESDGLVEELPAREQTKRIAGMSASIEMDLGPTQLCLAYITALRSSDLYNIDWKPQVGHVECRYKLSDQSACALKYECSEDWWVSEDGVTWEEPLGSHLAGFVFTHAFTPEVQLTAEVVHVEADEQGQRFAIEMAQLF
jgi:hypothetical protein